MQIIKNIVIVILAIVFYSCEVEVNREYYSNGSLKTEYRMRNGKFIGKYKANYDSGVPRALGQYKSGNMDGMWQYLYPNGKLQSRQEFKKGKVISLNYWNKDGIQVITNGTGQAKLYFPSGEIESIMSYKDNVWHGKCETWTSPGQKLMEMYYENGKRVGTWKYWDKDGKLEKTEEY